jgi:DNA-directed RNA polymerase subunit F
MTFSTEAKSIMLKAVRARTQGGATEAQIALAYAVTHGENDAEVLTRLIDDVRG